ncbi:MAG TPA: hypothetical protein VK215_15960 [Acidimicrobiales bacterium]|nr:hypothetical protein [Acidimicrobiales bacterium]HLN43953.1 hypothetical protein [Acidimicrobiales bacterium]
MTSPPGILLWIVIVGWLAWVSWLARHWYNQLSDVREANRESSEGPGRDGGETLSG